MGDKEKETEKEAGHREQGRIFSAKGKEHNQE